MGYGIILSSDDNAIRNTDAEQLGRDLCNAADAGTHSEHRIGAWHAQGAYHSTDMVPFLLTDTGISRVTGTDAARSDEHHAWDPTIRPSQQSQAARELHRHPQRYQRALATGTDLRNVMFGPDRTSIRSAWWFYADALRMHNADHTKLGAAIKTIVDDRFTDGASIGNHMSAVNRAGGLLYTGSTVALVWSGNRLCHPSDLTDNEQPRWNRLTTNPTPHTPA